MIDLELLYRVPVAGDADDQSPEWHALRSQGVGGSDAPAIAGVSPWRTGFAVYQEKVGDLPAQEENEAMWLGKRLEDAIAGLVAEREGVEMLKVTPTFRHHERTWQLANIDREVHHPTRGVGLGEIKLNGYFTGRDWTDDQVPAGTLVQGMHYLAVTGFDWVLFGALVGSTQLVTRYVQRDDELIEHLNHIEEVFWQRVLDRRPPPADGSKATTEFVNHLYDAAPGAVATVDPDEVEPLLAQRARAIDLQRDATDSRNEAENRLKVLLGEAEVAAFPWGDDAFTWRQFERRDLDAKALREAHPDIAAQFTRTTTQRRFSVPAGKDIPA